MVVPEIKYRLARGSDGSTVHISAVTEENRGDFASLTCIGCGRQLIPSLGRIKSHHFRHKAVAEDPCSVESYLHIAAKETVARAFNEAIADGRPYVMEVDHMVVCRNAEALIGAVCYHSFRRTEHDLTQFYEHAEIERGVGRFVADVLLRSRGEDRAKDLLVEICVAHPCDEAKVASGLRIVEIPVRSDDDIEELRQGIRLGAKKAIQYNLNPPDIELGECDKCPTHCGITAHYRSEKVFIDDDTLEKLAGKYALLKTQRIGIRFTHFAEEPFRDSRTLSRRIKCANEAEHARRTQRGAFKARRPSGQGRQHIEKDDAVFEDDRDTKQ